MSDLVPAQGLSAAQFIWRFRVLILLAWTLPPALGLPFLVLIQMFDAREIVVVLTTPLESSYAIGAALFALWYFSKQVAPIIQMLQGGADCESLAVQRLSVFPWKFWGVFMVYLLIAPSSVIASAYLYTDFMPQPVDWFRIHLVALIVSIIVGLPIYFSIMDLFGRAFSSVRLKRPIVTIKTKVFLIGALVPLLIDTMLVQYYWTKTGYFTLETFLIWLCLEVLAIAGSLMFVKSFSQSLRPLQSIITEEHATDSQFSAMSPQSTDEMGVLAWKYRDYLLRTGIDKEMLQISNRILRGDKGATLNQVSNEISSLTNKIDQVASRDIHALGKALQKLVNDLQQTTVSRNYFDGIIRAMLDPLIVITQHGLIQSINPAACNLLGYEAELLLHKSISTIVPRSIVSKLLSGNDKAFVPIVSYESEMITSYNESVPVLLSSSAMLNENGDVQSIVCVAQNISKIKRAERRLHYMATHDELTGLPNRVYLKRKIRDLIHSNRSTGKGFACLFLDLDRFKNINDTLGHRFGDRLLKVVADRLVGVVSARDLVVRFGGDEFVILLCGIENVQQIQPLIQAILQTIALPIKLDAAEFYACASIGISLYPHDCSDAQTLLKNADTAMYQAKRSGGNQSRTYMPEMSLGLYESFTLENSLHQAIEKEEFQVYYQPIFSLRSREIVCVEALIRWQHPYLGLILPDKFVPLLEEAGLIPEVDLWVMRSACQQLALWLRSHRTLRLAVNISVYDLQEVNFVEKVLNILRDTEVSPDQITLEITESVLLQPDTDATSKLHELHGAGLNIAIDDFGVGYSSLSYLRRLPVDGIKIDRSFVKDIARDKSDEQLVAAIIAMAHVLKLSVTSEGIESQVQARCLQRSGCDKVQGNYFSVPLLAHDVGEMLQRGGWAEENEQYSANDQVEASHYLPVNL